MRARIDTNVTSFVPHGDSSYDELSAHDKQFGGDPIVVILHGTGPQGVFLEQDQLLKLIQLEGTLSGLPGVKVVYGPGTVLNQTGLAIRAVLAQIAGRRDSLCNLAKAEARSKGQSVGGQKAACDAALRTFDQRYGSLVAAALPIGLPTVGNPRFVASVLYDRHGNPKQEWKFLAPDAKSATVLVRPEADLSQAQTAALVDEVTHAVDAAGMETSRPLVTGVPVLAAAVAQKARSEAPLLGGIALLGVGLVFLLLPWSRRRRSRLVPLASALLGTGTTIAGFGWLDRPLSLGVVAFMPILLGIGSDFPLYLVQTRKRGRILAAAAASAVAFASLVLTPLPFVRELGLALAIGVALTVGWSLLLTSLVGVAQPRESREPGPRDKRRIPVGPVGVRLVAVAGVVAAVAGWIAIGSVRIESSPEQLAAGLPELQGLNTAEHTLGFSGEVDIQIHGRNVVSGAVLDWERRAEAAVVEAHGDQLRPLLTYGRLLSFLGDKPTSDQLSSGAGLIPPYLRSAVIAPDSATAISTFGIVPQDVRAQGDLIDSVESVLPAPPPGYTVSVTGLPVLAAHGLEAMSSDRYWMNLVGLLVGSLVLGLLLRTWRDGAAVLVTGLLATGWLFAGVRLLGVTLSPLTVVVGALITVTSCEFATMLRRSDAPGGRSVAVAACAGTIGYASLSLSGLAVLRGFGLALAAGVVCSYVAARLVHATWTAPPRRAGAEGVPAARPKLALVPPDNQPKLEVISR
ncbi:MMPL family transporter [Nocardioides ultimimeridianus]